MSWTLTILLATTMFVTLMSIGIGLSTMRHYMPVLARLVRSDYPLAERIFDRENSEATWLKKVSMRMEFETADGRSIRANHKRWLPYGYEEKPCYPLWYHSENPEKTTAYGPGFWLVVAAISACTAITIILDPAGWQELI